MRFKGFEGEWEKKKLGEVAEIFKGKGISKEQLSLEGIPCILYGELYTKYKSEIISEVISRTNINEFGLIKSTSNDVIIPASGETAIDISTARCVVYDDVLLGGDLNILRLKNDNGVFLSYQINSRRKFDIAKLAQGISVVHLYGGKLKTLNVYFPNIAEQHKIASFLSLIDERIATQMKTIEKLETLIRGLQDQIFSQKLRFRDEKGNEFAEWEDKTLGEIGNFQTSSIDKLIRDNEKSVFLINYMNVYRHEDINSKTVKSFQTVSAKDSQIESCNLKKGDILFTPSSETADDIGHSVVISENLENTVFSYHLMRFRPNIKLDILYSHYFCNIPNVLNQLSKLATGSTRFTISVKSFSSIKIKLPTLLEQNRIANFLSSLDQKIETEKEILTQYQNQKKYLLQNLFI